MRELFMHMLEASLYGSVVILAVLLLRLVLKKAPKSVFCCLWLLAGLRLMLPFEIDSSFSLQPRLEPVELNQAVTIPVPELEPVFSLPAQEMDAEEANTDKSDMEEVKTSADDWESTAFLYWVNDGKIRPLDYGDIAAWVWAAGILVLCCASLVSYRKLKKQVWQAVLTENGCWECASIDTAFVLGFMPPKIYLPTGLSEVDRKFILDHEKTHIARHDHWWKLLGYGILAVHWFNPLVWVGYSLFCRDIEYACDAQVVRGMTLQQRKAYSTALLNCGTNHARIAACPVAFAESDPKRRIRAVLSYKRPGFWISLAAIAAVVFVAVCLMTSPGAEEPDLSFLNYENAISLSAEQEDVMAIYFVDSSICPGYVSGADLAKYLDNANWSERWWEPGDTSSPGSIEFAIGDDYRITVFDRRFARVKYGEEVRYYRIGRNDYGAAVQLLQQKTETELLSEDAALSRVQGALEEFQTREDYHISVRLSSHLTNFADYQFYQAGEDWLSTGKLNGTTDQTSYLKKDGACYFRNYHGLSSQWIGGFTFQDERDQMHWLRTFDWRNADIRVVRQGAQGEIETLPHAEGPFKTITCILTGPFEVYRKTAYGGILTLTFDRDSNLAAVELVASYEEALLQEDEISEEHILTAGGEFTQVSTQVLPASREDILSILEDAYSQVSQEEREKAIGAMYLKQCKAALEAVQSMEYYHIRVAYEFYRGTYMDEQHTADYWYDGENLLRTADANGMTHMTLLHNGTVYQSRSSDEPQWDTVKEGTGEIEDVASWLMYYYWNEGVVKYDTAVASEDGVTVWLQVEQPATIEGMYAESYELLFTFDNEGNLRQVSLGTRNSGGATMIQNIFWMPSDYEEIQREIQNYIYAVQYAE